MARQLLLLLVCAVVTLLGDIFSAAAFPQISASTPAVQGLAPPVAQSTGITETGSAAVPKRTTRPAASLQASPTGASRPVSTGIPMQTTAGAAVNDVHVHEHDDGGKETAEDHHGPNDINAAFGTPFAIQGGNVVVGAALPNGFEVSFASPQGTTMTVSQKIPTSTNFPEGWRAFEKESYVISMTPNVQTTKSALFLHYNTSLVKGTDVAIAMLNSGNQTWTVKQPPVVNSNFGRIEQPVPALQGEFLGLVRTDAVAPTEDEVKAATGGARTFAPELLFPGLGFVLAMESVA